MVIHKTDAQFDECILSVLNDLAFKQYSIIKSLCSVKYMVLTNSKNDNIPFSC